MADVADNGVVLHRCHVLDGHDHFITRCRNKDVCLSNHILQHVHLVALHRSLQGIDWVDFGHDDSRTLPAQALRTTFAHVAIAADDCHFASDHHVGRAIDGVNQRVSTAVQIVELALGHAVVHIDCWKQQLLALVHLVQTFYASRSFFGYTAHALGHARPLGGVGLERALQQTEHDRQLWV